MCRRVSCPRCGKPTFAGCGMHIEQVLGDVPKAERCRCDEKSASVETPAGVASTGSWWSRLSR